jgi:acyl dehydratase
MSQYQITARNFSETSENRIHSDEIAKKYGFKGALVPGVAVYGHLTYPLVAKHGEPWLSESSNNVRLLKPAYHGDALTLHASGESDQEVVICENAAGEKLAELNSKLSVPPVLGDTTVLEDNYRITERVEISWDNIETERPFAPWEFTLSKAENERYTIEVDDNLAVYQQGFVHPHLLLSLANTALMNEYIMPTWLHVGSQTHHRKALHVGDTICIRSVPLEKWRRKGHEFIRLWVTYWRGDEVTTDIMHTAIYKVAQ